MKGSNKGTAGAHTAVKGGPIGDRRIVSDSTVRRPLERKAPKNGAGPRKR